MQKPKRKHISAKMEWLRMDRRTGLKGSVRFNIQRLHDVGSRVTGEVGDAGRATDKIY